MIVQGVVDILRELVSFPSVVGSPNHLIVRFIADYLESCGAQLCILPGPEGDRSNIFASFGPLDEPGLILSGHMDVVPAKFEDWRDDPFTLKREGDRLYGRGASDMKGFLAAMLMIAHDIGRMNLHRPLHMAFSYDEEAGCVGVPHLIREIPKLCAQPFGCIVGEPSGMVPVLAHKGKAAIRIGIEGRSGHSSRPDLGLNAITALGALIQTATTLSEHVRYGRQNALFEPAYSTIQVGLCRGGEALNIIPAQAEMELEARAIPGVDSIGLLAPILAEIKGLEKQGYRVTVTQLANYPGLALDPSNYLAEIVRDASGKEPRHAVSYGTEAGLFQAAGIPSVICGPGDINRAHKPNEYILVNELEDCVAFLKGVVAKFA